MNAIDSTIQRLETVLAPDPRGVCFALDVAVEANTTSVSGRVENEHTRRAVVRAVDRCPGADDVEIDIETLAATKKRLTTCAAAAPVRAEPSADAEQVTQVLYGSEIEAYDRRAGFNRVRTPSGYLGWLAREHLSEPGATPKWQPNAVLSTTESGVIMDSNQPDCAPDVFFPGTPCRVENMGEQRIEVSFLPGSSATFSNESVVRLPSNQPTNTADIGSDILETAEQFHGTPYVWGGLTLEGVDCSGLVWIAYRCAGMTLPRDSDQQATVGLSVEDESYNAGDLLCFPGHIAISCGGQAFIHASGSAGTVCRGSLDPAVDTYEPALQDSMTDARRLTGG